MPSKKTKFKIPKVITLKWLRDDYKAEEKRANLLKLIETGRADLIPKKFLTKEILCDVLPQNSPSGITPYHYLAYYGRIPEVVMRKDCLRQKDSRGKNAIQYAAQGKKLQKIPRHLITLKLLIDESNDVWSPWPLDMVMEQEKDKDYIFKSITPRECLKYLNKIKKHMKSYPSCDELKDLVKRTETYRQVREMQSLKI